MIDRNYRQFKIFTWAMEAFGAEQARVPQRALRLLEESIEAFQAAGGNPAQAHELIDFMFGRPPGDLAQELGGVGVCLLALAASAGLSADDEECRECDRVLAKPIEHFRKRNEAKNAAGFLALPTLAEQVADAAVRAYDLDPADRDNSAEEEAELIAAIAERSRLFDLWRARAR